MPHGLLVTALSRRTTYEFGPFLAGGAGLLGACSHFSDTLLDDIALAGNGGRRRREPFGGERREIEIGIAAGDDVREDAAGGGRMLEAVAAEAVDQEETADPVRRPDNRIRVGRHLVEPGPRVGDRRIGQRGQPLDGDVDHLRQEVPLDRRVERGRFVRIAHAEQETGAFAMKVERRVEVDDHDV